MTGEYSISRRKTLRNIGAMGGFGTVIGATSGTASAVAGESKPGITELTGETAQNLIDEALNSKEYNQILDALFDEGIVIEGVDTKAYKAIFTDGRVCNFVSQMLLGGPDNESTDIVLSFGGVMASRGGIATRNEKNQINEIRDFTISDGSVVKNTYDLSYIWEDNAPSAAAYDYCDDFPDTISCSQCNYIVAGLTALSCSLQTAAYCAVITSETGIGPLLCAAAVGISCFVVFTLGTLNACEQMCAC